MLFGYLRTLRNYLKTPKGRHDTFDYLKALMLVVLTTLILVVILK